MKYFLTLLLLLYALPANAAVIFMYHRFGEDRYPSTNIRLAQFEAQLDFLEREGFAVWPLPRLADHLARKEPVPDKVVAITIDDAYLSVYEHAFPMLRERGMPFTVFVATDPVDQKLAGYMSWEQLRELHAAGVTLANHGASHGYLVRRKAGESHDDWAGRVREDIVRGQARLQEEISAEVNESPRLFAYPFGEYDTGLMAMLEQMGYLAFGQHSGAAGVHDDPRTLPRFPVNERYGELPDFALKARSLPLPVLDVAPRDPVVTGDRMPVLKMRLDAGSANLDRLSCYFNGEPVKLEWIDRETRLLQVHAQGVPPPGRSRYNCTAPHESANRWYWYSHLWIRWK